VKHTLAPVLLLSSLLALGGSRETSAQDDSRITVNVVLVQLNVAVTDRKGNYISGLKPEDFVVTEDKIPQKISTFEEGYEPTRRLVASGSDGRMVPQAPRSEPVAAQAADLPGGADAEQPAPSGPSITGANVFILFDTSNYMYRGFVFAQDAIADFVRSLEGVSHVAFYSYSRDLSRAVALTGERSVVLRGVRSTVAGDDAALYNSLLMTVKDAAQFTGRKAIVVFSNGPDNASLVPPEDVAELAQSTGTIIYMISTRDAQAEPISTAVFERMSRATGGKAYFSKSWKDEKSAFDSIREDLAHLYSLSYYPQPNPNRGWRTISVKLTGEAAQKYRIRTRDGYRVLKPAQIATTAAPAASSESPHQ
jgi:Ca-activated chloride channel homolog